MSSAASAGSAISASASASASSARIPVLPRCGDCRRSRMRAPHRGTRPMGGSGPPTLKDLMAGLNGAITALVISARRARLVRQRIGPQLEVRRERLRPFAALDQPRRAVAVCGPQPTALPARIRIVDAAVEALRIEAERIRNADRHHLAVLVQRHEAVHQVGGRHRNVVAEPEGVVLVDPRVVARLGAVLADALEAWAGILVERPALRAVVAGRLRAVERALAQTAIEHAHVPARERHPDAALLVDVAAAWAEARQRHVVLLGPRFVRVLGWVDA